MDLRLLPYQPDRDAAMAALVAAMRALPPARCDDCDAWVEPDYRFCAACGAQLRGRAPLIASNGG